MKITKHEKVELAVSKDPSRFWKRTVHLDAENKRLVATNGHIMAIVPVDLDDGDTSGPITTDALVAARKVGGGLKADNLLTLADGRTFPRESLGDFPSYEQVIPKTPKKPFTVRIDAALLQTLAKAIGADSGVVLTFDTKNPSTAPILVRIENSQAFGVLMPMRLATHEKKGTQ